MSFPRRSPPSLPASGCASGSNLTFESSPADEKQPRYFNCQDNLMHWQTRLVVRIVRFAPLGWNVVDQPRLAKLRGGQKSERFAFWIDNQREGVRIAKFEIVDLEAGVAEVVSCG
jgi:hypothetical protein